MKRNSILTGLVAAALLMPAAALTQQNSAVDEIARYRELLQDGNPADLWEARGEGLWKESRGPRKVTLERCDLGKGPGVVKGAYAEMPRFFADAGRVMDLETRLVYCMVNLQGIAQMDATRRPYGSGEKRSDIEALTAWITSESRGHKMNVALNHPQEKEAYQVGEKIFFYRGGPHDFSCATCHSESNKRIRLQDLPNLTDPKDAQRAYTTWPAYRVSQGELRTMQWRLYDCFRQQRFPELQFTSDVSIALTTYLAKKAEGGVFEAPTLKR